MRSLSFTGTVFFHIGRHKTGTTSIQRFLTNNYNQLLDQNTLYTRAGRARGPGLMPMHHPLVLSSMDHDGYIEHRLVNELDEEIQLNMPVKVVLSSEVLSRGNVSKKVFESLRCIFANAERHWIVYLRRQDELILSTYQENIKREILFWPNHIKNFYGREHFDHLHFLNMIETMIGGDRLHVRLFDKDKQELLESFLDLIGVTLVQEMTKPGRENERLPWRVVALLRYVNALPPPVRRRGARLVKRGSRWTKRRGLGSWLDGAGPLNSVEKERIMREYAGSNLELVRRYFTEYDIKFFR